MFVFTKLWIVILCFVQVTISARILILCTAPSISHHLFYRKIIRELSLNGHEVVSITPDPMNDATLTNLTEIDIHNETYGAFSARQILEESKSEPKSIVNMFRKYLPIAGVELSHRVLNSSKVKELITNPNEHFDVFINELFMTNAHFFAFKEHFNCPAIAISSVDAVPNVRDAIGNPPHPNYYGSVLIKGGSKLTFWERLELLWLNVDFRMYYFWDYLPEANKIIKKHFKIKTNDAWELEKSVDLVLANANPIFNIPQPLVPNYIQIGGYYERKHIPLPQDLKEFLDNSPNGVVYFSLGSNIQSGNLPNKIKKSILEAFDQIPYNIIWKFDKENLADISSNVLLKKWLPQPDLLDHPNVKAFITHGGIHSVEEAIDSGVPIIGVPFGADQDFNIYRVVDLEIGRELQLEDITTESLVKAITDVVNNPKYKNNIKKLSELNRDQIIKPLDRAIWWIEYVIRHKGAKQLRSPAADLPWYKFLLLDIIGFVVGTLVLSTIAFIYLIKIILRLLIFRNLKNKTE
ncbi:UDP-glucosyltransferase 2-like [Chrysoperla carnea]|uniref:UDP-glucosyltransferase 2-like n=1 Tax=Chrysoperla carnea TaxID=189513 RepID=UPI001D0836DB|nr:UDP-glucosyltransferase 2-like [Chrysoperla carnea]